ncbi:acyl carrier protein [Streptomyces sp. NPDC052020]|uniref:acyl carrier protein n=1 Tax=Streptomyces sp. NPDC052020 TaxID=3155677 RepID=UPI003433EA21
MSELLLDRVADDVVAALETGLPPAGGHSRLYEDLGFDSLMLIELVDRLQERRPALGDLPLPDMVGAMADIASLTDWLRTTHEEHPRHPHAPALSGSPAPAAGDGHGTHARGAEAEENPA